MSAQYFEKYASLLGLKPFDTQDSALCVNGFEAAVAKIEKCGNDDLRKLAVSTIQAVYSFLKSSQRTVLLLVQIAQLLPKLLSNDLSLEMSKVISPDQGTKISLVLLEMCASTSSALLSESNTDTIAVNCCLIVSATAFCKSSSSYSEHLQRFLKQLLLALSTAYSKTHLVTSNTKEISSTIGSMIINSSSYGMVKDDLRSMISADLIRKMYSNINMPSSSSSGGGSGSNPAPQFNSNLSLELMSVLYAGDKRFAKVDLGKCIQLYLSTHLAWSKVGTISDATYLLGAGSSLLESAAQHLKSQSSVWAYRIYILLAMIVHLTLESQLAASNAAEDTVASSSSSSTSSSGGGGGRSDLDKAATYITSALEALKLVSDEINADNAVESMSILSLDSKVLSQLMALHGSLKYPAKLLKYTQAAYTNLYDLPPEQCSRSSLKELEQVCNELRLNIRLSQVFSGLFDTRDIDIHKSCFTSSDVTLEMSFENLSTSTVVTAADCIALCETFVLGSTHLIHRHVPLYSKQSPKYQAIQLEAFDTPHALESLVVDLHATFTKNKAALGHRLSVFLHASLSLTLAKVLHLVFNDVRSAYRWGYKALCQVDRRIGYELQQLRVEAMLMLLELYDQVGGSDFCLQYMTELLMEVSSCPSQSMKTLVNFHLLRVWYRQHSTLFQSALEKFPSKRNDSSIDDSTSRIVDVVNLIRSCLRRPSVSAGGGSEAVSSSFRQSHWFWNFETLCDNAELSVYHSYLPPVDRRDLTKHTMRTQSSTLCKASLNKVRAVRTTPSTVPEASELMRSLNFDVVRTMRRSFAWKCAPNDNDDVSFRSFIAAASSCCVSSEFSLEINSVNRMPREICFWSEAITSVLLGDEECVSSGARIRSRLQDVVQLSKCSQISGDNCSASVCVAAIDEHHDAVYLGRLDENSEMVITLPNKKDLVQLVSRWHSTTAADKQQLYNTSICEKDKVWTEEERRSWRQSRKAADQLVQSSLEELQQVLGPWRVLVCGLAVNSGREDGEVRGVAKALFSASLDSSNKAGSKKGTKGKASAVAAAPASEPTEVDQFKQDCMSWIDFILFNTTPSSSANSSSDGTKLSKFEAEVVLTTVAQSWDMTLNAAGAKELASKVVSERFPIASAATQLSALFTTTLSVTSSAAPSVDYSKMSAEELKDQVKKRGLKPKTTKSLNIEILIQYDADSNATAAAKEEEPPVVSHCSETDDTAQPNDACIPNSVLLILDETLQCLPWENITCLRSSRCTRMPGLALLLANPLMTPLSQDSSEQQSSSSRSPRAFSCDSNNDEGADCCSVSIKSSWAAVDINDNLEQTRNTLSPFLQPYTNRWNWKTFTGVVPTKSDVKLCHEGSYLFIYCGHGAGEAMGSAVKYQSFTHTPAAMLWGCSSGRLKLCGVFDPTGPTLHYLLSGSTFVVGNLWDMTSGDLDELSVHFMRECLPQGRGSVSSGGRGGEGKMKARLIQETTATAVDLGEALVQARSVCRFKHANGCAPVVYGVCQQLKE